MNGALVVVVFLFYFFNVECCTISAEGCGEGSIFTGPMSVGRSDVVVGGLLFFESVLGACLCLQLLLSLKNVLMSWKHIFIFEYSVLYFMCDQVKRMCLCLSMSVNACVLENAFL